jgi:hypothetical protein
MAGWEDIVQKVSAGALTELWSAARSATVERGHPSMFDFLKQFNNDIVTSQITFNQFSEANMKEIQIQSGPLAHCLREVHVKDSRLCQPI